MPGTFLSIDGDLERLYINDVTIIDQYLKTGSLWFTGRSQFGELGDPSILNRSSVVQTTTGGNNWKMVSGGETHTAAVRTDGSLLLAGSNLYGQLGDNTVSSKSSLVQTISAGTNWVTVSCGQYHTAAVRTDGTLWSWGLNTSGQLGDNSVTNRSSPVQITGGGTNWRTVSCGANYSAAVKTDGTLWSWGLNDYGQLGDNTVVKKSSPVQIVGGGTNWQTVSCGGEHVGAIKTDGTLWMWGRNQNSQLGTADITDRSSPVQTITGGVWSKVSASSGTHTVGIKQDGTLWTWGSNSSGELGTGDNTTKVSPVQTVSGGTNWRNVFAGNAHTAAIKTDGTLWAWGSNTYGQLGDGTSGNTRSSPIQIALGEYTWNYVSCGYYYTGAIRFNDGWVI